MQPDLAGWWNLLVDHYQVSPLVFGLMYGFKTVALGWLLVLIVQRARRQRWDALPALVVASLGVNVSPWVYVWLFGRNLPDWYPWIVYGLAGWGLAALALHVRRRLHQLPGPEPVLRRRGARTDSEPVAAPHA